MGLRCKRKKIVKHLKLILIRQQIKRTETIVSQCNLQTHKKRIAHKIAGQEALRLQTKGYHQKQGTYTDVSVLISSKSLFKLVEEMIQKPLSTMESTWQV